MPTRPLRLPRRLLPTSSRAASLLCVGARRPAPPRAPERVAIVAAERGAARRAARRDRRARRPATRAAAARAGDRARHEPGGVAGPAVARVRVEPRPRARRHEPVDRAARRRPSPVAARRTARGSTRSRRGRRDGRAIVFASTRDGAGFDLVARRARVDAGAALRARRAADERRRSRGHAVGRRATARSRSPR